MGHFQEGINLIPRAYRLISLHSGILAILSPVTVLSSGPSMPIDTTKQIITTRSFFESQLGTSVH